MNANPRGRAELKQAARGVKREADDSLDDDQRFAKRFDLLNIGMSPVCGRHERMLSVKTHVVADTISSA